jgi:hypothetical protein
VANRSGMTLHDTIVAFNTQVYIVGEIAPGASVKVELSQDRQLSPYLRSKLQNYLPTQPYYNNYNTPGANINRPDLMLGLMFHDAASGSGSVPPLGKLSSDWKTLLNNSQEPGS